jgi:hypothetical protein
MSGMTNRHRLSTLLVIGSATVAVAGCGGSSGDGGSAGQSDETKALAFAKCLRKAGINAADPQVSGGKIRQRVEVPKGIPPARVRQITEDCARKTGGGPKPMSKADRAKFLDAALKFARCMRAHGVDIPDPQPGNGGGIMIGRDDSGSGGGPKIDPSSPAFQRAQKACATYLPGGKGGAPAVDEHSDGRGAGAGASLQMQSQP